MENISFADFRDFADRVRDEDPDIDSTWLPPDLPLQLHGVRLDDICKDVATCLAVGFKDLGEDDFPMHYCAWGKARVGSTALNNLFGLAGFPAYYQPVKSALRTAFAGDRPAPWILPAADSNPAIFTKETQGPYSLGECLFIPLRILIEAGYPPSKLRLIVLERDPERSLASWLNKLTTLVPAHALTKFHTIAALNANRVRSYARRHGVPITHYVYEASKEPLLTARALFAHLGISHVFNADAVTDWGERGHLDSATSHRIIYPPQPPIYDLPGLHGSDRQFHYRDGGTCVGDEERHLLETTGVYQMYRDAVTACIRDLNLDFGTATRIFGPNSHAGHPRTMPLLPAANAPGLVNYM
jgi:hypothetical protein